MTIKAACKLAITASKIATGFSAVAIPELFARVAKSPDNRFPAIGGTMRGEGLATIRTGVSSARCQLAIQ